jgi:branched-chain amino acid transport system ATP-binding protein
MPILELDGISKRFGGIDALNDVSLYVDEKEIVGLIGPNGSGKTTLVNVVSGVYSPNSGKILFKGKDITRLPSHLRCRMGIARTYQVTRLFPNLTVLENVLIGVLNGRMHGKITLTKATGHAEGILETVGLSKLKDLPAKSLVAPQRRILEFARALATDPQLLILDECVAGLTTSEVSEMLGTIKRIRDEKNITIIMIEHIMHAVMTVSDRVIVLHEGRKIAEGTPEKITKDEQVAEVYFGDRELALRVIGRGQLVKG